jgi:hypothetical protein
LPLLAHESQQETISVQACAFFTIAANYGGIPFSSIGKSGATPSKPSRQTPNTPHATHSSVSAKSLPSIAANAVRRN